jgi:ribosomal protein L15
MSHSFFPTNDGKNEERLDFAKQLTSDNFYFDFANVDLIGQSEYFKSLKNHVNLVVLIAVSLIIASVFATLLLTNMASILINGLKLANRREFTYAVFAVAVFVFALAYTDVTLHRAETIDLIMVATFITSIFALIIDQLVMKQSFVVGGLMFTVVAVISLAFIILRTRFVKVLHQADVEELVVQAPVEFNEQPAVVAEEETVATQSPELVVEEEETPVKLKRVNVKKSFEIYLRTGDEQLKDNYSQIKNELLSYGIHSRFTQMRENFSKKGLSMSKVKPEKNLRLQAKLLIRGKFLKLYLNVDPSIIDAKYFRTKDVSLKMPDQPTYIKVRSKLSLKRALELIQLLAEKEGFKKKKKFEPVDYKAQLTDENLSYMQKLGYDYMVKDSVTYQEVLQYREDWVERVIKTKIIPDAERYIYDEISLKNIEKEYNDGDVVDLESLRAKTLIKINCNHLTVTSSETLSKKLYINANVIDNKTAQMIIIAGGEVTRLVFD